MLNVSSYHSFNSSYWHTKRAAQGMVRKLAIYTIKLQKNVYSGICLLQSARPTASVQKQIFSGVLLNNCSEQFLNFPEKNLRQHPFLVKLQALEKDAIAWETFSEQLLELLGYSYPHYFIPVWKCHLSSHD